MSCLSLLRKRGFVFINNFFTKQDIYLLNQGQNEEILAKIKYSINYMSIREPYLSVSLTKKDIYLMDRCLEGDEYFGDWYFKNTDLLIHKYSINKEDLITYNFKKYRNNYLKV